MYSFPDSILLQLFECVESKSHDDPLICEINLPMPEINCSSLNYSLESYEFASSNQFKLVNTSGILKVGAGWAVNERTGEILVPPSLRANMDAAIKHDEMKSYDAIAALGVSRMQDIEKLTKWIIKSNLDPNDPRNADLISLIKVNTLSFNDFWRLYYYFSFILWSCLKSITENGSANSAFDGFKLPEHFRLDQLMQEFNFVSEEDIENNKRFRLIALRAQDEPEFRGLKLLPNDEKFIKRDTFDQFEKRKRRELSDLPEPDETEEANSGSKLKLPRAKEVKNEIEEARIAGQKHVQKIRHQILAQFKFIQSQKTLADMVIEEQVPDIK